MGKGDKKTRRGKIVRGSYGVLRPRKKKPGTAEVPDKKAPKKAIPAADEEKKVKKTVSKAKKAEEPKVEPEAPKAVKEEKEEKKTAAPKARAGKPKKEEAPQPEETGTTGEKEAE